MNLLWAITHLFSTEPRINSNFGNAHKYAAVKSNLRYNPNATDDDVAHKQRSARNYVESNPDKSIAETISYFESIE